MRNDRHARFPPLISDRSGPTPRRGLVSALVCAAVLAATGPASAKYGKCSQCRCIGFSGNSYQCSRGGCGHHYDQHW